MGLNKADVIERENSNSKHHRGFEGRLSEILKNVEEKDSEYIANEIDEIFKLFQRFVKIKYLAGNNNENIDTNFHTRILNKLVNHFKRLNKYSSACDDEKLSKKIQSQLFTDVCKLVNCLVENPNFTQTFNTFPKTSINDYYLKKSIGGKFSQLVGRKSRSEDKKPEGGCCHYRSLLLYDFFSQLKNLGLDLEIKFFREKTDEMDEDSDNVRHSGLIFDFQGKRYIAEKARAHDSIIDNIQSLIKKLKKKNDGISKYFVNYYKKNFSATVNQPTGVVYFNNTEDFLKNLNNNPESKSIQFHLKFGENLKLITFSFFEGGFDINIDGESNKFYLDTSKIYIKYDNNGYNFCDINGAILSPSEFCRILTFFVEKLRIFGVSSLENAYIARFENHPISEEDNDLLDIVLPIIFKRANVNCLDFFPKRGNDIVSKFVTMAKNYNIRKPVPYDEISELIQNLNL